MSQLVHREAEWDCHPLMATQLSDRLGDSGAPRACSQCRQREHVGAPVLALRGPSRRARHDLVWTVCVARLQASGRGAGACEVPRDQSVFPQDGCPPSRPVVRPRPRGDGRRRSTARKRWTFGWQMLLAPPRSGSFPFVTVCGASAFPRQEMVCCPGLPTDASWGPWARCRVDRTSEPAPGEARRARSGRLLETRAGLCSLARGPNFYPGLCTPACGLDLSLPKKTFAEPGRGLCQGRECPALWLERGGGDPRRPDRARGRRGHHGLCILLNQGG